MEHPFPSSVPLVARFRTPRSRYVYDTNTNQLVRVDRVVFDLLGEWGRLDESAMVAKWAARHEAGPVREAIAAIKRHQARNGLFSTHRIRKLHFPLSRAKSARLLQRGMQQLVLEATENCNLRCRYCIYGGAYQYQRGHSPRRMAIDTALKAIDLFVPRTADIAMPTVSFYGGEPLLRLDLIQAVVQHLARRYPGRKLNLNLTTNGLLLKGKALRLLAESDVGPLVSLDGPREVHDRMRVRIDGGGSFDAILGNLQAAQRQFPEFYGQRVSFAVTLWSPSQLARVRRFFARHPQLFAGHRIFVNFVDPLDTSLWTAGTLPPWRDAGGKQKPAARQYVDALLAGQTPDALLKELCEVRFTRVHQRSMTRLGETLWPNGICIPGVRRLFCSTQGRFSVCERVSAGVSIGSVDAGIDAEASWNLARDYARLSSTDCAGCWAVRLCSACFCHMQRERLDPARKRLVCRGIRRSVLEILAAYCAAREVNDDVFAFLDHVVLG